MFDGADREGHEDAEATNEQMEAATSYDRGAPEDGQQNVTHGQPEGHEGQ